MAEHAYQRLLQVAAPTEEAKPEPLQELVDLPADIYGLTISVATSDLPAVLEGRKTSFHLLRLLFGLVCLALNIWLQLLIVMKVDRFIVTRAVHTTQVNYAQYHAEVFDSDGNFLPDQWENWDGPKDRLCGMAISKVVFTSSIVFLWTTRMLNEVQTCFQLTRAIFNVEWTEPATKTAPHASRSTLAMLDENNELERLDVVAIGWIERVCLACFVTVPKLLVGGALLYGGCRWFAATESWEELILNALALEFVIGIDELIFEAFAPLRAKRSVEMTKLVHILEHHEQTTDDVLVKHTLWSLLQIILCMVWAYVYTTKLQQVIPNFTADIREHCAPYLEKKSSVLCEFMQSSLECFPYGK